MRSQHLLAVAPGLLLALAPPAAAHVQLREPTQRTASQKDGPCGAVGSVRGSTVCRYRPGATIRIRFEETVEHAGHFRLSFDDAGQDFRNPAGPADQSLGTGVTILDNAIPDRNVNADGEPVYYYDLTLPDVPCSNCTLQLMQVMSTGPVYAEGDLYYQCADIELAADAPATPTADCAMQTGDGDDTPDAGGGSGDDPGGDDPGGDDPGGDDPANNDPADYPAGVTGGCNVGRRGGGFELACGVLALAFVLARPARRRQRTVPAV